MCDFSLLLSATGVPNVFSLMKTLHRFYSLPFYCVYLLKLTNSFCPILRFFHGFFVTFSATSHFYVSHLLYQMQSIDQMTTGTTLTLEESQKLLKIFGQNIIIQDFKKIMQSKDQ